ncbi:MAG: M20/M25/M40 family metallo-hydrolase [Elusimicrobia bacterium]|nr:M20/M25/M40 family metallo-hydrolase [Elusimicrobiota bacterium]
MNGFLLAAALAAPTLGQESDSLVRFVSGRRPWTTMEANSEQRQPLYLGKTPLELALGLPDGPVLLPAAVRAEGEAGLKRLLKKLKRKRAEFELWPAVDEEGQLTWAVSRWRAPGGPWSWLAGPDKPPMGRRALLLPRTLRARVKAEYDEIFLDILKRSDLYGKPALGDCVWTEPGGLPLDGWKAPDANEDVRMRFRSKVCRALPQPCVVNGQARVYTVAAGTEPVRWPEELGWAGPMPEAQAPADAAPRLAWPPGFAEAFMADARALSGEEDLVFADGRRLRLTRKNSAQADHQLSELLDWLEARYKAMGLATWRDRFWWRGVAQSNLFASIPGSLDPEENRPVLLADHVDTAFAEDIFKSTRARVSVPGADDDVSGTAALLRAAEALKGLKPKHDIWLTHLTGEEFPGDDLGARRLIRGLLAEKRRLSGVLILDMIAYREKKDPVFQLSVGEGAAAARLGAAAFALSTRTAAGFSPVLRGRWDPESYLYNTDALIFSEAGFPALLFNEHLNLMHNIERRHYHESTDSTRLLDAALAEAVARAAAETAAWLAEQP